MLFFKKCPAKTQSCHVIFVFKSLELPEASFIRLTHLKPSQLQKA